MKHTYKYIGENPPNAFNSTVTSRYWVLFLLVVLCFIWLAVYTGWSVSAIQSSGSSREFLLPVLSDIINGSSVSIAGSYATSQITIYQYVSLQKAGTATFIDSTETPRTQLPLFSASLLSVNFPSVFENGDTIIYSYYTSSTILGQPLVSVSKNIYFSLLVELSGQQLGWSGEDYTYPYPYTVGSTYLFDLGDVVDYVKGVVDPKAALDLGSGRFGTLIETSLVNPSVVTQLTQNITVHTDISSSLIFLVDTQKGTRRFWLPVVDYDPNLVDLDEIIPKNPTVDFYIDYGDGSDIEHYQGTVDLPNAYHDYAVDAPATVNVTITGSLIGWNADVVRTYGLGQAGNAMILDVLQWGDVNLQAVGFYREEFLTDFSAGPIPTSVQRTYIFFPKRMNVDNAVNANFATWDVSNWTMTYLMLTDQSGTLHIENWDFRNVQYASYMFYCSYLTIPTTSKWNFTSLEIAYGMFYASKLNSDLNATSWDMRNLRIATDMFYLFNTSYFTPTQNLQPYYNLTGTEYWNTGKLEKADQMCRDTDVCSQINVTTWNTTSLINVDRMFYGACGVAPVYTNWDMSHITNCQCFMRRSNCNNQPKFGASFDYDLMLYDWYRNTNSTNLVCKIGSVCGSDTTGPGAFPYTVSTYNGIFARSALAQRTWCIRDDQGTVGTC